MAHFNAERDAHTNKVSLTDTVTPAPNSPELSKAAPVSSPPSDVKERGEEQSPAAQGMATTGQRNTGATQIREQRQFYVDTAVKILQMLALVASGIWAVEQYREQQSKDRDVRNEEIQTDLKQRKRALYSRFYDEQRPLYMEACRTAAEIAAARKFADVRAAITKFRALHFGPMLLVEDKEVLWHMNYFFKGLEEETKKLEGPSPDLRIRSVFLARACRVSLKLRRLFNVEPLDDPSALPGHPPTFPFGAPEE